MALQQLEKLAHSIDKDGIYPKELLKQIAQNGDFAVLKSRADIYQAIENIAKISNICGTSGFCMWCQFAIIYYLINSDNQELKNELLPKLYSGEILGGTALSNPMKAFAGIEKNHLSAKRVEGGYIINGTLPWVSNITEDSVFGAIAIDEDNDPVMGVIRVGKNATLKSNIKYAALEGSATKSVVIKDYFLSHSDILATNIYEYLIKITPGFILLQTGIAAGIIKAALDEIEKSNKTHADINSYLNINLDELKGEFSNLLDKIKLISKDVNGIEPIEILKARLEGSLLTQKVTNAAVLFCGTKGYFEKSHVARLQREGNFVLIVTPSIKHLLKEIAQIKAGFGCIKSWRDKL
ncbi:MULTISPECIES: acyl-CoA dehydrogenase family protein [Campylobacter]|uniref:acyl-CoA dehydrogenase family protein n=1 Tax=Campylobacter TaxID=194 RepID=UPI000A348439|nr:acyl-CoA dehydrogenase family protein [Campylobacter sp. P0124]MCR8695636.1 acyl-CoA/acyl-ACP dehydrogenase [Campylobacter sp. RM19073]